MLHIGNTHYSTDHDNYFTFLPKSWATIDDQIVDPETAVEFEMRCAPKVHTIQA